MLILENDRELINKLSDKLEKFDRVFFFSGKQSEKLCKAFCAFDGLRKTSKKILILSPITMTFFPCERCVYRKISKEEQEVIEQLYRMYEFSDRIQMISDAIQYGSLFNYVKTGLMTIEEVFNVLLI